jgi:NAD(P)H dehydrogenase (quinone)
VSEAPDLYLLASASGRTGLHTAELLLGGAARVRALVHRHDHRSQRLAELGAEVIEGDLLDFGAVSSAMVGVTGAYFCYPISPGRLVDATAIFAQAAGEAGVRSVVNMSQISARREAKSHAAQQHWLAERLWDRTALITTHLRPTFFAEWLLWQWSRHDDRGILRLPFGLGRHAPIASADQARVITAILTNPAPHDRQIYPLFGPVELDHHQIAARLGQALNIEVDYEPVEVSEFARALKAQGATPFLVQHLSNVAQDYRDGVFSGTNNLVEVIGGRPATTVEEFAAGNRHGFDAPGHDATWSRLRETSG